jgi:hypothetical protein
MTVGLVDPPVRTDPPAPARRGLRGLLPVRPDPELERLRRLRETQELLERARALVADGWVQDAFYVVRGRSGETRPVSPFGLLLLSRSDVVGACLVGAVAHASAAVDRRQRSGPAALAVDTLWATLSGSEPDTAHPSARPARVRDLARWNDEPGRSREDVLDLLDRSVSRTIHAAVR